ncbi:B-cell linker protein-like isoform X1 [Ptychodera flava]|uniref:B-cell linker protein-like isoform X1 n=1 Tax=Ptychodera flava TaxID=63121 RepID=UPI003969DA2E
MATKNLPSADVLQNWTVNEVQDWLKLNNFNEFVLPFRGHKFDGRKLLMISEQSLAAMNHEFPEKKQKSMVKQVEKVKGRKGFLRKFGAPNIKKDHAPAPAPKDYMEDDEDDGWGSDFDDDRGDHADMSDDDQPDYDLPPEADQGGVSDDDQPDYDLPPELEDAEYVAPTDTVDQIQEEFYEDPDETPPTFPRRPHAKHGANFNPQNGFGSRPPALPTRPGIQPPVSSQLHNPMKVPPRQPQSTAMPVSSAKPPPRPAKPAHMIQRPAPQPSQPICEETYEIPEEQETYEVPLEQEGLGYKSEAANVETEEFYEVPQGHDDEEEEDDFDYEEPEETVDDDLYQVPEDESPVPSPKTPGSRPPMPLPTTQPFSSSHPAKDVGKPWQRDKKDQTQSSVPPVPKTFGPKPWQKAVPTIPQKNENNTQIPSWKYPQSSDSASNVPAWKKKTADTPQITTSTLQRSQANEAFSSSAGNISEQRSPIMPKRHLTNKDEEVTVRTGGISNLRKMFEKDKAPIIGGKPATASSTKPEITVRESGSPSGSGDGVFSKPPALPEKPGKMRSPGNSGDGITSRPPLPLPSVPQLPSERPPERPPKPGDFSKPPTQTERTLPERPVKNVPLPRPPSEHSTPPPRPVPLQPTQSTPPPRPAPLQPAQPARPPPSHSTPPSRLHHKELPQIPTSSSSTSEFEGFPFYHGPLDRKRAEAALKDSNKNGAFIVRDGRDGINSNDPYTISVWYNGKPWNLKICKRPNGKYALGAVKPGETTFDSPLELVQHHRDNSLVLAGDAGRVCLMIPAPVYD